MLTDGLTKILRFDNTAPELGYTIVNGKVQEKKATAAPDPANVSNYNIYLDQINFSLISQS